MNTHTHTQGKQDSTHMYVCMYVCMVCMICIYISIYTHTHTHTRTHTHVHIHMLEKTQLYREAIFAYTRIHLNKRIYINENSMHTCIHTLEKTRVPLEALNGNRYCRYCQLL